MVYTVCMCLTLAQRVATD